MSKFAIIETGGKQYRVQEGDKVRVEKLTAEAGNTMLFDKVLLVDGSELSLGTPYVPGKVVNGTITEIGRSAKVTVIKYKQKSRYFKKNGHRQPFFKVKIGAIV